MTNDDRQLLTELHTMASITKSEVADIKKAVFGNGQPGIKDRLISVEHAQASCLAEKEADENRGRNRYSTLIAVAAVAVAIAALFKG